MPPDGHRHAGLADASISVWGREIGLSTTARRTDAGACILDHVAEFCSWARDNDVTMEPFFETRDVTSTVTATRRGLVGN